MVCITSVFKHAWTYYNTGLNKKYFASKFKSTLHNLAANSITSQMEPERTTHAKVLFKKENRYFANVWSGKVVLIWKIKEIVYSCYFETQCYKILINWFLAIKLVNINDDQKHPKPSGLKLNLCIYGTIYNKCCISWSVFNTHETTKDEKPICTNFIDNIW